MYKKAKKDDELVDGVFVKHEACVRCNSADNLSIYEKEDEDGEVYYNGYCWTPDCGFMSAKEVSENYPEFASNETVEKTPEEIFVDSEIQEKLQEIAEYKTGGSKKRKIRKEFMEMYGVKMTYNEDGSVKEHFYPVTKNNEITGYKIRKLPKAFSAIGDCKNPELFGQWLYESGKVQCSKKFLCITEGQLDAIALKQVLDEKGNPSFSNAVVSIENGAGGAVKSIQSNWKWANKFEQVILFFDQDEPGKKAALEVAKKMPLGKVKIAKMSEKDPCEMLRVDKKDELYNAFWKSELYAPDGVLSGSGLWNIVDAPLEQSDAHYPWTGLDKMLHGIRASEMVTLTAGSGVSKSTMARFIAHHLQKTTDENIGMIFLEESVKKTALTMMSIEAGKPFHIPETQYSSEEKRSAFDETLGTGKYYFFDDFASQDFDSICESILYMARAVNVKYIFLDHISMLVSGGEQGDERRALDAICTKLRSMVQQLDIALFTVTHLKRPNGVPHEEGGQTSLSQLRGSAGIAQLSDIVIGFERNMQAEDPIERNTTHVRVLKNRFSGECSYACSLLYNPVTGLVRELCEDEVEDMDTDSSEFDLPEFEEGLTTTEEY